MSDNLEKYRKAIQLLSENEFNDFVKLYNKVYYGTEDVVDTNGPYDAGIDLSIHVNGRQIKKVVQITVQKTDLEKKIMGDIAKAVKNVKRNGFFKRESAGFELCSDREQLLHAFFKCHPDSPFGSL